MRASRGARAWVRTLRAMTYVFVVGAILLFGHAFVWLCLAQSQMPRALLYISRQLSKESV